MRLLINAAEGSKIESLMADQTGIDTVLVNIDGVVKSMPVMVSDVPTLDEWEARAVIGLDDDEPVDEEK